MHKQLIDLCVSNADFFQNDTSKSGLLVHALFLQMKDHVIEMVPLIEQIQDIAPKHDFDESIPGNGFRSALIMTDTIFTHCINLNLKIETKRKSLLFPKFKFKKELETHTLMIKGMASMLLVFVTLIEQIEGELFYVKCQSLEPYFHLIGETDLTCFFGKHIAFNFCKSMRHILKQISVGMATYDAVYHSKMNEVLKQVHWIWSGGKYLLSSHLRAQKHLDISQCTTVDFVKSFWTLTENDLMGIVPAILCPKVAVNQIISIPAKELEHVNKDGSRVKIAAPHSHSGSAPVQARLLSYVHRKGMDGSGSSAPQSRYLLFHCHGGGFVAHTSRSHEIYLRDWAKQLDMPILSIDYSLAPESPYPRALEEALYSYVWALQNASRLGTTAEYVVFAGDSAGANLVLCTALKCIELGVTPPVGLMLAYVPVLVCKAPSPSRILSIIDPLVPFGFLLSCINVYACPTDGIEIHVTANNGAQMKLQNKTMEDDKISSNRIEGPVKAVGNEMTNEDDHLKILVAPVESESLSFDTNENSKTITKPMETNGVANVSNGKKLKGHAEHSFLAFVSEQNMCVSNDPFFSPFWATDEILSQLPPVSIVTVEFDPCLDDCVYFAKKLKSLHNKITLDILSGLPHGFLNLAMFCKEAHDGSDLCAKRIKDFFQIDHKEQV